MLTSLFPPNTGPCTTGQSCTYFFFTLCVWLSFNHWLLSFLQQQKKTIFTSHSYFLKEMGNISCTVAFLIFSNLQRYPVKLYLAASAEAFKLSWDWMNIPNCFPWHNFKVKCHFLLVSSSARGNLEISASCLHGSHSLLTLISHFITTFLLMPLANVWISVRLKITTA